MPAFKRERRDRVCDRAAPSGAASGEDFLIEGLSLRLLQSGFR
jgi:hypothetical protein